MPTRAVLRGPSGDFSKITMCKQDRITAWGTRISWCSDTTAICVLMYKFLRKVDARGTVFQSPGCTKTRLKKIKEEEMDVTDTVKTKSQVQIGGKAKKKSAEEKDLASSSRKRPAGRKITAKLCKAAKNFTSNFPHFKHCITRCNVEVPFLLTIPTSFLNAHLPQARTEFTFWTSKEKSWEVTLLYTDTNKVFSKGWRRFAVDNKLEMDDSCVFELVAPREMRVHIFPTERENCSQLFVQV
ncbi:PREDICTED: B3 domain-containing protein Os11g0197600-like [Theobroma cacao]|uniref:B3 domain-containing protein Os11g0197600-like n=1 Tax=Theobroma cacao TaxID=3641 RepID=A0AB32VWM7_THECC|nr:PREDICTED: B3 domain-containing protein Os11g0197600-like [Theobroma cacao]